MKKSSPEKTLKVTCPSCKKQTNWSNENLYRPFCSERCQIIDLGAWAAEEHRVPGESVNTSELPSGDEEKD